jgi:hypothetical protein
MSGEAREGMRSCPACFRQHHTQAWECAACERRFICDTQFVTTKTYGGTTIRAHIRPGNLDALGEACGPMIPTTPLVSMTVLAKAKERAGVA